MGLSRDHAARLLSYGWGKPVLVTLHQCLNDSADFLQDFVEEWGVTTEAGLFLYRSHTIGDVERAFQPPIDQRADAVAYTDGSGTTKDKPAGIGVALYAPGRAPELYAQNIGPGTNNRAELAAVWCALRAVPDTAQGVLIRSDSEYAIGSATKDWTNHANAGLIANIRRDLARRPYVRFEHVSGHAGVEGNEVADRLSGVGRKLVTAVTVYEG